MIIGSPYEPLEYVSAEFIPDILRDPGEAGCDRYQVFDRYRNRNRYLLFFLTGTGPEPVLVCGKSTGTGTGTKSIFLHHYNQIWN